MSNVIFQSAPEVLLSKMLRGSYPFRVHTHMIQMYFQVSGCMVSGWFSAFPAAFIGVPSGK